jgi:hypothetical protein
MDFPSFSKIRGFIFDHPFLSVGIFHAILITIYSIFTFFWGNGHIVFIDLTEGINLSDASNRVYYAYANNWGEAIAEKQRVVPFSIMWFLYNVLHLGEANFVPFRILFGYYLSIIGFVFMLSSFKSRSLKAKDWPLIVAIFAATGFYLYNPWMTNRILHNFLYFSSFTVVMHIGLLYQCLFKEISNKKFYILLILNGLLLGNFMTTPHTALLVLIPTVSLIVLALMQKTYLKTAIYSFCVPALALLSGLYWVLPFVLYKPVPDRVESTTILQLLSQHASVLNVLKLQGYWWDTILPGYFPDSFKINPAAPIVFGLLYLIPLLFLAYAVYYYRKLKITYFILAVFAIGLFLSSYNLVSKEFYEFLMFKNSLTSSFGWLFREVEKFSYLLALCYSVAIFLVLNIKNKRVLNIFYIFLIFSFLLNFSYLIRYTNANLRKVPVPNDYAEINKLLLRDKSEFNVAYYPQVQYLKWAPRVDSSNYISNLSSDKPALPNVEGDSYTKYFISTLLDQQMVEHVNVGDALNLMGIKYLIIRNDMRGKDFGDLLYSLDKQPDLNQIWSGEYLTVYENKAFNGLLEIKEKKLVTNLGLNFLESFTLSGISLSDYYIEYSDLSSSVFEQDSNAYLLDDEGFLDLAINKFSNDFVFPSKIVHTTNANSDWAITSLSNKTHAENDLYFNNFNITTRQFNYGNEVILSLGGLSLEKNSTKEDKDITSMFEFPNLESFVVSKNEDGSKSINFSGTERDYVWNIFRSNKIGVSNVKSIGLEALFEGSDYLEPHVKFYYYDANNNQLGVQVFYPQQNNFSGVFRVPLGVSYVDFSVWVRGKGAGRVDYKLNNLKIYDMGVNYAYPQLKLKVENNSCKEDCALYARVLESSNYPSKIEVSAGDGLKNVINNTRINSKYKWVKVLDLPVKPAYDLILNNSEGFNSIATLVVLNENELQKDIENNRSRLESEDFEKITLGNAIYYEPRTYGLKENTKLNKYIYHSPVEYEFTINTTNKDSYLVFKKPAKPGWSLTCGGVNLTSVRDFAAVWKIGTQKETCKIYYKPQGLFTQGKYIAFITFATSALCLGLLIYTSKYRR